MGKDHLNPQRVNPHIHFNQLKPDELLKVDPEPCEFCSIGIRYMFCHDGQWRCRSCVMAWAVENGWDEVPEPPEEPAEVVLPEVVMPQKLIESEQLGLEGFDD